MERANQRTNCRVTYIFQSTLNNKNKIRLQYEKKRYKHSIDMMFLVFLMIVNCAISFCFSFVHFLAFVEFMDLCNFDVTTSSVSVSLRCFIFLICTDLGPFFFDRITVFPGGHATIQTFLCLNFSIYFSNNCVFGFMCHGLSHRFPLFLIPLFLIPFSKY